MPFDVMYLYFKDVKKKNVYTYLFKKSNLY